MSDAASQPRSPKELRNIFHNSVGETFRYNAFILVAFEGMWWLGFGAVLPFIFIPSYLNALGSPKTLIGIIGTMWMITMPMNFLSEFLPRRIPRKTQAFILYALLPLIYFLIGGLSLFFKGHDVRILIFSAGMTCFYVIANLAGPIYYEICTDNVPINRRGMIFALRMIFGAIMAAVSGYFVKTIFTDVPDIQRYFYTLLCGGVLYCLAVGLLLMIKDNVDPARIGRQGQRASLSLFTEIYLILTKLWFRPNFRTFILFAMAMTASAVLGTFIITYSEDVSGLAGEEFQMQLKLVYMGVIIAGSLIFGLFADKSGFLITLRMIAILMTVCFLTLSFSPPKLLILIAYGLNIFGMTCGNTSMINMVIEMLPRTRACRLLAAVNLFCLPVVISVPWIFGAIIDAKKTAGFITEGYAMTFLAGVLLAVFALAGFMLLVQEPRSGKIITYRHVRRI